MIQTFWELEKLNAADGRPFKRCGAGRSFVKNMMGLLYMQVAQLGYTQIDIGGTSRALTIYINGALSLSAGQGGDLWMHNHTTCSLLGQNVGIVVGTGTAAVGYSNTALATPIVHGVAATQLLHWGGVIREVTVSAPYAYFDIMRIFENQSSGDITPTELGFQSVGGVSTAPYAFLICRDVLAAPDRVTLANTELLKVTYRIRVSV